ncbi:MAG: hypothetical protein RMJ33_12305 [Saprospiraceae bacterium]|nr:hypothetical protein [Saprospiraceae bacterium]MDW8230609.1 hypothetical protein [Saprospiraceae bacterium]
MKKATLLLLLLPGLWRCHAQPAPTAPLITLDEKHTVRLLDSAQTASALLLDTIDYFFQRITAVEMSIQMKRPLQPGQRRADLLPDFEDYLRRDAASFTPNEQAFLADVVQEMWQTAQKAMLDVFPDTLLLLKIKGKPYGPSVYYTRQNAIVIPQDVLQLRRRQDVLNTLYHELFHIYSRLRPSKRTRLYRRIGFEPIGLERLQLPQPLAERVLHNPDGTDFAQKITLQEGDKIIEAIPIIYANEPGYTPRKRLFFAYLEFSLFEIIPLADGRWHVRTQEDGLSSTIDMQKVPDFYRQIGDNTTYIIHPDEVLADNFALLMASKKDPLALRRLSENGQKLIRDIEAILRN